MIQVLIRSSSDWQWWRQDTGWRCTFCPDTVVFSVQHLNSHWRVGAPAGNGHKGFFSLIDSDILGSTCNCDFFFHIVHYATVAGHDSLGEKKKQKGRLLLILFFGYQLPDAELQLLLDWLLSQKPAGNITTWARWRLKKLVYALTHLFDPPSTWSDNTSYPRYANREW